MLVISKEQLIRVRDSLLVAIVILYSGSAYAASINSFYGNLKYFVTAVILVWALVSQKGQVSVVAHGYRMPVWILISWACLVCVNWIVHGAEESLMTFISRMLHLVLVYEVVCIIPWERFRYLYIKWIKWICIVSLVGFYVMENTVFIYLLPTLKGYDLAGQLYDKYQGFLVYFSGGTGRNYGAFWEPGIFASHIILAFLLLQIDDGMRPGDRFSNRLKGRIWLYTLFVVTLISTQSTAGYLLLILTILNSILSRIKIYTKRDLIKMVGVFLTGIAVLNVYFNIQNILSRFSLDEHRVFEKMLEISDSQRMLSIEHNWRAFIASPLIGNGYTGLGMLYTMKDTVLDTATSFRMLAVFGITGILFTYVLMRGVAKQATIPVYSRVILGIILLCIINKEPHDSFLLTWCLIMYTNQTAVVSSEREEIR